MPRSRSRKWALGDVMGRGGLGGWLTFCGFVDGDSFRRLAASKKRIQDREAKKRAAYAKMFK